MLIFIMFCVSSVTVAAESSFTQSDRDRMIRFEEGLKATNQRIDDMGKRIDDLKADLTSDMNRRFEQVDKRFDQMYTLILWGFGILLGGMGLLMGFVLWDRRTSLAPAIRKTREIEERAELLEKAIKEAAIDNPGLREALKHVGLL